MTALDHAIMAGPVLALIIVLALGIVIGAAAVGAWTAGRTARLRRRVRVHCAAADADRAQVAELTGHLGWLLDRAPREVRAGLLHRLQARGADQTDELMRAVMAVSPVPPDPGAQLQAELDVTTSGRHARVEVDPHGDL
jgi:hypothetical protein